MLIFLLLSLSYSTELESFIYGPSELTVDSHVKLTSKESSCELGYYNSTIPFGVNCDSVFPLYFDDERHTHFGVDVLTEADLVFNGMLTLTGEDQWVMIKEDYFTSAQADGWSFDTITTCAGVSMLGGYCQIAQGESEREFTDLPDHSYLRVKAVYHFIDDWRGETGYAKINSDYVWTLTYDLNNAKDPIDVCGDTEKGEGKFSEIVDVKYAHTSDTVTVAFGSNLEDQPCNKSWGVSGFELYVK